MAPEDQFNPLDQELLKTIIQHIEELHAKGAPVLVGTRSVELSERLGRMLKKNKVPHNVLNAKYHEQEAGRGRFPFQVIDKPFHYEGGRRG